jgi:hypothetical protein
MAVGSALVVNLILSLADERRPRLAVLRALGLSRSGLVTLSMLEGALYSLAAAFVSLVTGAAIVWVMFAYSAASALADVNGRDIVIQPFVRPGTVVAAVAFGALITLLTVFAAAVRTSNMTISSAIKDLPEREPARRRSWLRLAGLMALTLAGMLALAVGDIPMRFVGGLAVLAMASSLVRGRVPERTRATLGGVLVTAWGVAMLSTGAYGSIELAVGLELYLLGTITLVFGLSILIAANLRLLEALTGFLSTVSPGLRAALRPPLAYMTRRPTRAGLTIGAFGLVVAMVTSLTVLGSAIGSSDLRRDSGGFDVEVTSAGSQEVVVPSPLQAQIARSVSLPTRRYIGPQRAVRPGGAVTIDWHEQLVPLYELSEELVRHPLARLTGRDPRFARDVDVWNTVASDPTWVISNWGGQGASLWLDGRDGPVELKVAATFAPGLLDGIAGSAQALAPFADLPVGVTTLVQARPGTDPVALALEIRRTMFADGVEASTTKALLEQGQTQGRTWLSIFRTLILIGLVVGALSLGVLSLRAVLERRRAIGVLRALGYQSRAVLAGIIIEAMLTTALGIAVGMASGLAATYFVFRATSETAPVPVVDVGAAVSSLVAIYAALLAVTLIASSGPALRASRLTPIEALRTVD